MRLRSNLATSAVGDVADFLNRGNNLSTGGQTEANVLLCQEDTSFCTLQPCRIRQEERKDLDGREPMQLAISTDEPSLACTTNIRYFLKNRISIRIAHSLLPQVFRECLRKYIFPYCIVL